VVFYLTIFPNQNRAPEAIMNRDLFYFLTSAVHQIPERYKKIKDPTIQAGN
jgi:hypothetical protein